MPKFKVEFREVVFTEVEVEAESLDDAISIVQSGYDEVGNKVDSRTDELTARIHHDKGEKELKLI